MVVLGWPVASYADDETPNGGLAPHDGHQTGPDRGPLEASPSQPDDFDLQGFFASDALFAMPGEDEDPETGQSPAVASAETPRPELTIEGFVPRDLFSTGGTATVLNADDLEALEHSDPHQVLLQVPGVNVRGEDGFGLRPNIGIRGALSDRSSKVTLMEDGVLFGPAPYAAPAAYYFPLVNRMTGVEVFKGPAAILFGPQTLGGAINLRTRQVPTDSLLGVDGALGSNLFGRLHIYGGGSNDWGGLVGEVLHTHSNGFKRLDRPAGEGSSDTGFSRTDAMFKGQLFSARDGNTFHLVELKLGLSQEGSNETYLGLTDADFAANPVRRYAASARDRMAWWRSQVALRYQLEVGNDFTLTTTAYRHDFQRSWLRLNRMGDSRFSLYDILRSPTGARGALLAVLRGEADSSGASDTLFLIDNDRRFVSMGIQTAAVVEMSTGPVAHRLEAGLRLHGDEVDRTHVEAPFLMRQGRLVRDTGPTVTATDNVGSALALAGYAAYRFTWEGLSVSPGLRAEWGRHQP